MKEIGAKIKITKVTKVKNTKKAKLLENSKRSRCDSSSLKLDDMVLNNSFEREEYFHLENECIGCNKYILTRRKEMLTGLNVYYVRDRYMTATHLIIIFVKCSVPVQWRRSNKNSEDHL